MGSKHPLADCENCPLEKVGKFVPSTGPGVGASLAVVGEAPGIQEARTGVPFIGPSGKVLDAVLNHHGIKREDAFLTNAALCRPPDNGTPPQSAVRACNHRLVSELKECGAPNVLLLGNTAAQSLLETRQGIMALRVGPGRESAKLPGVRVIPTIHPAAALRQSDLFPHIVKDVGKIGEQREPWREPEWRVSDDPADALAVIQALAKRADLLAVDIEVGIEKDVAFDHPNNYSLLCVGLSYDIGKAVVLGEGALTDQRVLDGLGNLLAEKKIVAQNGKFDLAGLYRITGGRPKLYFDTMLASYVLDERPGNHGLDQLGIETLGTPNWKSVVRQYVKSGESYANIPREVLYRYNAYDVAITYELALIFADRLDRESQSTDWPYEDLGLPRRGLREVHDMLCRASDQLMYVELNGIAIDKDYNDKLTTEYLEVLAPLRQRMSELAKKDYDKAGGINPNSPMQIKEYFHDQGVRLPLKPNQKGERRESTDECSIDEVLARLDPQGETAEFCRTLLEHRRHAKLYGTYVKGIRKRMYGGRVFPTFLLHGTTTGRLACRNPNLQNIPRESRIRQQFVPAKPDHVFVQADYGQAELRVLCFLAQDKYLRGIFNDPSRDLFDELTPVLYPGAVKPSPQASDEERAAWKELRIRVKAYVYGLSYGREAFSISAEYKIPVEEAVRGMEAFFKVIPDVVEFRKWVQETVLRDGQLVTPFGRTRRYGLITNDNRNDVLKEALAFIPQSTASDLCLNSAVKLRQQLKGVGWIRNLVHDSILLECHEDDAEMASQMMSDVMSETAQELLVHGYVEFPVDSKVGKHWGEV